MVSIMAVVSSPVIDFFLFVIHNVHLCFSSVPILLEYNCMHVKMLHKNDLIHWMKVEFPVSKIVKIERNPRYFFCRYTGFRSIPPLSPFYFVFET